MHHPNNPDHARHDATLIAGHAAGDLSGGERARADAWLAECGACGELRRDLVAIAAATRSLPAPASLQRDLRLAPEQADRLRRGSWLRAFLRPFGAAGTPFRPMATAFTSLGIVGLVVGITLSGGQGLAGSPVMGPSQERANAPAPAAATAAAAAEGNGAGRDSYAPMIQSSGDAAVVYATTSPRQLATGDKAGVQASPSRLVFGDANGGGQSQPGADAGNQDLDSEESAAAPGQPNPLIAGSLALLGIGLLLFGLRIASRRVG